MYDEIPLTHRNEETNMETLYHDIKNIIHDNDVFAIKIGAWRLFIDENMYVEYSTDHTIDTIYLRHPQTGLIVITPNTEVSYLAEL